MAVVIAFGDSITQGADLNSGEDWPAVMQAESGHLVINAGVGGNNTCQALARLHDDVLGRAAQLVVVEFGMNDHCYIATGQHRIEPDLFARNLTQMVNACLGKKLQVALCLIHGVVAEYYFDRHPCEWYSEGVTRVLTLYNSVIDSVAEKHNLPVIDIPAAFSMADGDYATTKSQLLRTESNSGQRDGVHLTAEGARIYAKTVLRTVEGLLQ